MKKRKVIAALVVALCGGLVFPEIMIGQAMAAERAAPVLYGLEAAKVASFCTFDGEDEEQLFLRKRVTIYARWTRDARAPDWARMANFYVGKESRPYARYAQLDGRVWIDADRDGVWDYAGRVGDDITGMNPCVALGSVYKGWVRGKPMRSQPLR